MAEGVGTGAAAAGNLATTPLPSRLPWHWSSPPPGPPPFSSAFLGVSVPHWVSYARETPHRASPTPLSREAQESNLNLSLKDEQGSVGQTPEAAGKSRGGARGRESSEWPGPGSGGSGVVPRLPCGVSPGEPMPAQVLSDQHLGRRPSWDTEKGEMPAGWGGS